MKNLTISPAKTTWSSPGSKCWTGKGKASFGGQSKSQDVYLLSRFLHGRWKKRKSRDGLCLDLSRHINKLLKKEVVRLSNLDKALQVLLRNDVQATYDLVSAYHHVAIHPDHQELLGCALPDPITGETVYFEFTCMPFGLATATHCLTRLTKPICIYITRNGIRHTIFIDDGKVNARIERHSYLSLIHISEPTRPY